MVEDERQVKELLDRVKMAFPKTKFKRNGSSIKSNTASSDTEKSSDPTNKVMQKEPSTSVSSLTGTKGNITIKLFTTILTNNPNTSSYDEMLCFQAYDKNVFQCFKS